MQKELVSFPQMVPHEAVDLNNGNFKEEETWKALKESSLRGVPTRCLICKAGGRGTERIFKGSVPPA